MNSKKISLKKITSYNINISSISSKLINIVEELFNLLDIDDI